MRLPSPIRLMLLAFAAGVASLADAVKSPVASDYVLQPSDLVRVQVFQEPDLDREVRITQEHTLNLPLIGNIALRDLTVRQAEELIRGLYDRNFLVNPQITITVREYTQRTVQVTGSVNAQGAIPFVPEQKMGLVEAIARAGGHSRLADLKNVRLTRTHPDGRTETFTINVAELMKGGSGELWLLQKGDVIFVPERIL